MDVAVCLDQGVCILSKGISEAIQRYQISQRWILDPLSTLINSFLKQLVVTRRIELYAPEPMTPKLESIIAEIESQLQSGEVSKKFADVDKFLADLKS